MKLIIKLLASINCNFLYFCRRMDSMQKELLVSPSSIIHQAKFSLLRKNMGIILKVPAALIEISGSPREPNPVNMADGVGRPI